KYLNKLHKGKPRHVNPNTPVYLDGALYVTSRFVGGVKLKVLEGGARVSEIWWDQQLDPHHGGVVLGLGNRPNKVRKQACWQGFGCLRRWDVVLLRSRRWLGPREANSHRIRNSQFL
ncbi:MAG: hypothetical protein ACYSUC_08425, partial [Planctomycetota bacterium]